jgi:hypothetical protein
MLLKIKGIEISQAAWKWIIDKNWPEVTKFGIFFGIPRSAFMAMLCRTFLAGACMFSAKK